MVNELEFSAVHFWNRYLATQYFMVETVSSIISYVEEEEYLKEKNVRWGEFPFWVGVSKNDMAKIDCAQKSQKTP